MPFVNSYIHPSANIFAPTGRIRLDRSIFVRRPAQAENRRPDQGGADQTGRNGGHKVGNRQNLVCDPLVIPV